MGLLAFTCDVLKTIAAMAIAIEASSYNSYMTVHIKSNWASLTGTHIYLFYFQSAALLVNSGQVGKQNTF